MAYDFKKDSKEFYRSKNKPEIVNVPKANYIAVRGSGDPNEEGGAYQQAINVLYAVAYTLKMSYKTDYKIEGFYEYVVPPLEGFWWQENVSGVDYSDKSAFCWISVIRVPDFISQKDFDWAVKTATNKKKIDCSSAEFITIEEGLCVQIMHVGSFDEEPKSVAIMDEFIEAKGYVNDLNAKRLHHEIYLSDARKVPAEKCKTIIRHPIKEKEREKMKKISKITRIVISNLLCAVITLAQVPSISLTALAEEVVTAKVTTEVELINALNNTDVDRIHLQNEITLSRSEDGKDNAFVIQRPVTITGEGTNGGLCLERAGIVLGGAVTLEHMSLYFANPVRNAIIANGYDLTLYSVSNGGSPYNIDIFAGAVTDYTGGNLAEIPKPGVETNIIIKGSNALKGVKASVDGGNIYAGSLSDVGSGVVDAPNQYDGNVSITIEKDTSGFGKIYAHGARENREGGYPDVWDSSADLYKVTGRVDVTLQETTNVVVDGATGGAQNANFTYKDDGNGYLCTPTLENIAGIDLLPSDNGTKANLEPYINEKNHEEACNFSHLSVPENTRLSLANIAAKTVIAKTFTGGGEVVFSEDTLQKLCVTEEISGITKVAVGGIDAEGTNSIGSVISDKTYITIEAEKTEDYGFELLPDLNNYTMMLKNDGNGNWVAILEETSIVIGEVEEIADVEAAEVINGQITSEILVPIAVTYATENENNFFGDIPLLVTVNGKETSAELGYSGYQYATGTTDKDIFMGFTYGEEGEVLYIANGAGYEYAVPVGRYEISLMVPGRHMESGTTKTISFILTITCAEHSGGTADCQSQAICEVCGKKYGKLNQQNHAGKAEVKNVKAATCNEEGYTGDIYCNACGVKTAIGTKTAKREHVWNGGVVTREATATQKGEKTYTCSVCKTSRTEEIPAFGLPQIGAEITSEDGTAIYKVTKVGAQGNAVTYKALADKKITSVVVPASITINSITYKVTAIAAGAFAGNKKITSVSVGNNVTAIPAGAFKNCKKLTTVKIGKGVKSIGKKAFYGCKKLKTLKIQTTKLTTKKIGSKAFGKTPKSMKVTLPKKKYKTYKSMLIKKGVNKKAKFKKEKSNTKV